MVLDKLEYAIMDKIDKNVFYNDIPNTSEKKCILRSDKIFSDWFRHLTKMRSYYDSLNKEAVSISAMNVTLIPPCSLSVLYKAIISENENLDKDTELSNFISIIQTAENENKFLAVKLVYTNINECQYCGQRYEVEEFANMIKYCPECLKRNELSCEYGYGTVTPCYIYCGGEFIGRVTISGYSDYYLHSEKFMLNLKLKERYLNALNEADEIISHMLKNDRLKSK